MGGRRTGYPFSSPARGRLLLVRKYPFVNTLVWAQPLWQPRMGACEGTPSPPAQGGFGIQLNSTTLLGGGWWDSRAQAPIRGCHRDSASTILLTQQCRRTWSRRPRAGPENASHAGRRTRGRGEQRTTRVTPTAAREVEESNAPREPSSTRYARSHPSRAVSHSHRIQTQPLSATPTPHSIQVSETA